MSGRALRVFIRTIFDITVEKCGTEYADEINTLRRDRERFLSDSWRGLPPEDLDSTQQKEVFREIDFDTIIIHAVKYLETKEYLAFLYEISEIAVAYGEFEKGQRLLSLIIKKYYRSASKSLLAKAHQKFGDIAFYQNDLQLAYREYRKSDTMFDRLGDKTGSAFIKNSMGAIMVEEGKLSEGESCFLEAKKLAQKGNLESLLVRTNINLGNVYIIYGSWDQAMACYQKALSLLLSKEDNKAMQGRIYHSMAIVYKSQKNYAKARECLEKSVQLSVDTNNPHLKGLSYLEEAEVSRLEGDISSGTALATTAFHIFSELGDRLSMADVYKVFGIINRESKHYDLALSYFENSLRINRDYNHPLNLGETLFELGKYYVEIGKSEEATNNFKSALESFQQIQAKVKIEEIEKLLSTISH